MFVEFKIYSKWLMSVMVPLVQAVKAGWPASAALGDHGNAVVEVLGDLHGSLLDPVIECLDELI